MKQISITKPEKYGNSTEICYEKAINRCQTNNIFTLTLALKKATSRIGHYP